MAMERWEIDSGHSGIHFSVRHLALARIRGQFTRWSGTMTAGAEGLQQATIRVLIDATSISTGLEDRDAHLRSRDFLDTGAFPDMTFQGQVRLAPRGGRLRVAGEFTILGVAHPLACSLETTGRALDPWGRERASFAAKGVLDRTTLGITWNQPLEPSGFLLGNRVDFEIEGEAVRQDPRGSGPESFRAGTDTPSPRRSG